MRELRIQLPNYVFEQNFLTFLGKLSVAKGTEVVCLDFQDVRHYIPAAITAIVAAIRKWEADGREVFLVNHRNNSAFRYLQRIEFFSVLGLHYNEDFTRHSPLGEFVTITEIREGDPADLNRLVQELVGTLVPEDSYEDLFRLLQYALGEIIRNCLQHSFGDGYVSAQYNKKTDLVRIGIADNGIGVKASFETNGSPHFRPIMGDRDCLRLAITPEVSSRNHIRGPYGDPENAGVGLSIVQAAAEATCGHFVLASGSCVYYKNGRLEGRYDEMREGKKFQGTVTSVAFQRGMVYKYAELLMDAKESIGLFSPSEMLDEDLFE